jgi:septal ring factor EnvC (AmiA/AmiB activator)
MLIDLSTIPTEQLREIKKVLEVGILSISENKEVKMELTDKVTELEKLLKETSDKLSISEKKIEELSTELAGKSTQIETLTKSLEESKSELEKSSNSLTEVLAEVETLRVFKAETEKTQATAKLISTRQAKVTEAGLDFSIEKDTDKWLAMSEEVFEFTVSQMSSLKKSSKVSSSEKEDKVPPMYNTENIQAIEILKKGLSELK